MTPPWRQEAWANLARLNGMLENGLDMTICYSNAIWDTAHPDPTVTANWVALARYGVKDAKVECAIKVADYVETHPLAAGLLAATLVHAVASGETDDVVAELVVLNQRLREVESFLPIRTTWLAWCAMFQLTGDSLGLARARDRRARETLYPGPDA